MRSTPGMAMIVGGVLAACGGPSTHAGGGGSGGAAGGAGGIAATAIGGAQHVTPKRLWSFDPDSYFSDKDFLEGSGFSRELAVVANTPPGGSGGSVGVVGLDVKTGRELWRRSELGWLLHPPHATEPLYFAPYEKVSEFSSGFMHLERLDPRTGKATASITLDRKPELDFEVRMVWSAQALVMISGDAMTAFDWSTGAKRWTSAVPENAYLFAPAVIGDRIYLPNTTNVVISLTDGKHLAEIPGECCTVVASPDGAHVFVRAAVDLIAELGPDLAVVRRFAGTIRAASNTHYAVEVAAPTGPVISIYAYDTPKPVHALVPNNKEDFYSAIALSGAYLFSYHDASSTLTQTDLRTLKSETIETIGSHFVVSTEVIGSSGPYLGTPPIIERPYLFMEEWGVHGYLIGDE